MNKLICLAVLFTVCAISSARYGIPMPKPGICPANGKTMRHWCRYDYECPGIEKCCSHGYGGYGQKFFCTIPEKPGRCPYVLHVGVGACLDQCSNDFDCPYGLKCCFNGCGNFCTRPEFGKTY